MDRAYFGFLPWAPAAELLRHPIILDELAATSGPQLLFERIFFPSFFFCSSVDCKPTTATPKIPAFAIANMVHAVTS